MTLYILLSLRVAALRCWAKENLLSVASVEDPELCRRVSLWLATSRSSQHRVEQLELGTYWVFAGLESEPFPLLNTET